MRHRSLLAHFVPIVVTLAAPRALAGQSVGNGGDALVCRAPDGSIVSARLYDYFEAEELRGQYSDLGGADLGVEAKVQVALERLRPLDPARADRYAARLAAFDAERRWTDQRLADLPDPGTVVVEMPGCAIEQAAVRLDRTSQFDPRFLFSRPIWNAMGPDDRAGLVMHEIVYEGAYLQGHTNSRLARSYNGFLSTTAATRMAPVEYRALLVELMMADDQILLADRDVVLTWHEEPLPFAATNEVCAQHEFGWLYDGYLAAGAPRPIDYRYSQLVQRLSDARWWGQQDPSGAMRAMTLRDMRFRAYFESEATALPFLCANDVTRNRSYQPVISKE